MNKLKINEDELYKNYNKLVLELQGKAIKKYGIDFTDDIFYSKNHKIKIKTSYRVIALLIFTLPSSWSVYR